MSESGLTASAPFTGSTAPVRRVLVVEDHPIFRHGIVALIEEESDFSVCAQAESSAQALALMREHNPDVVLMDISLPGTNGVELIKMIKAENPGLPILVLSMHPESLYALRVLRAGALGYIMKAAGAASIVEGLHKVLRGELHVSPDFRERLIFQAVQASGVGDKSPVDILSPREREVLELVGRGFSTRDIGSQLNMGTKTVETHRGHIRQKLGFRDSGEMIRFAVEWVSQEDPSATTSESMPGFSAS